MKRAPILAPILLALLQAKVCFGAPQDATPSYGHVGRISYDKMVWSKLKNFPTNRMIYTEADHTGSRLNRVSLICDFSSQEGEEKQLKGFGAILSSGGLVQANRRLSLSHNKVIAEFPGVSASFTKDTEDVSVYDHRVHAFMSPDEQPPTSEQAKEMQDAVREMCIQIRDENPTVGDGVIAKEMRERIGKVYTGKKTEELNK